MSDFRKDLKCNKVIDKKGTKYNKSPAREIKILNAYICEEHQKELSKFIARQLGEEYEDK